MKAHEVVRALRAAAVGAAVLALATAAQAQDGTGRNPVTHWNAVAEAAFTPSQGTNPMAQSRTFAILHAAIHDAVNAVDARFEPYTPGLAPAPGASMDAAVAAAARDVLVTLLPEQAALARTEYERALAAVPESAAKAAGIAVGQASARATLARRRHDGFESAGQPAYAPRTGVGEYQFTPGFEFAALPSLGRVQPFAIALREHRVSGPQALATPDYARDLAHVKEIDGKTSTTRTADQSEIAKFWYEDSPLGWNRIARTVAQQRGLDAWAAARAFALVHFAMADGFIAGFDAKYEFRFWRPITAIRQAATDGNPSTQPDPGWEPFLVTPPVPDYPSTHTVLGWAAAEALIAVFGDKVEYAATSLTLPGVVRRYRSFSSAAEENGLSRIYAGIHFRHAVNDGKRQGRSVGKAAAQALRPLALSASAQEGRQPGPQPVGPRGGR